MADPRIQPVDVGRLPVPAAGADGMRVMAAGMANEMGGQNYSGNASETLGEIGNLMGQVGKGVSMGSQFAGMARQGVYSQQANRNNADINSKASQLNVSANNYSTSYNEFLGTAATLSSLQSTALGYQQRGEILKTQFDSLNNRNNQIKTESDALMLQLRNTRDKAAQTQIKNQLTNLRNEAVSNSQSLGNIQAESVALKANLDTVKAEIDSTTPKAVAQREQALGDYNQMRTSVGELGQSMQNAMNDQQAFANFMTGVQFGGASGNAVSTIGQGFTEMSMQNYGSAALGIGAASVDYMSFYAPSIAGYGQPFKATAFGIGATIDSGGNVMAGFEKANEVLGTLGHLNGMMNSIRQFHVAEANGDAVGMYVASLGATGNSLQYTAEVARQLGISTPEMQIGIGALDMGGAFAKMSAAGTLNLTSGNYDLETLLSAGAYNTVAATNSGFNLFGIKPLELMADVGQTIRNLWEGRELGNPLNPRWRDQWKSDIFAEAAGRGQMVGEDLVSAYKFGLQDQLVLKQLDYNLLNPRPLSTTYQFDGASMPLSFPWSVDPINPFDPVKTNEAGDPEKTFTPSYELPWNPQDPFNLDPFRRRGGEGVSDRGPTNVPTDPDCPNEPPKSKKNSTGNWRTK